MTHRTPRTHGNMGWLARAAILCAGLSNTAISMATVDLALRLETSMASNSNLFWAPEPGTINVPGPVDAVSTLTQRHLMALGAGIPLGSEDTRLVLTTQINWDRYKDGIELNSQSKELTARLPWRFEKLVEGEFVRGHTTEPYALDQDYQRLDLVTRDWHGATLALKPTPWLSFPVQVVQQTLRHQDRLIHGGADENRTRTSAAIRYQSPTGSTAQLGTAKSRVTFPGRDALPDLVNRNQLTDQDLFLDLTWDYSSKTLLNWRWTSRQRTYPAAPELNSQMAMSRLNLSYTPSPLSRIDINWAQEPSETDNPALLYSPTQSLGVGVSWFVSPLTTLSMQWQRVTQKDRVLDPATAYSPENLRATRLTARAQHSVTRGVNVFLDVARQTRTRDNLGRSSQNVFRVGLDYTYDNMPGAQARTRAAPVPPQ